VIDTPIAATIKEDGRGAERPASQAPPALRPPDPRPIVQVLALHRYRVQFTIGQQAHDDLRTVQALLRREIPSGDEGAIFERALALLRKEVEKTKLGVGAKPRRKGHAQPQGRAYEKRIRFRTDKGQMHGSSPGTPASGGGHAPADVPCGVRRAIRRERAPSRHVPNDVKRAVWYRDRGQCAFASATGRRCGERAFLELHHIQPYALEGPATVGNISLRCRRHNQYEAETVFGSRVVTVQETGSG
jgi:hypothetical protein